MYKPWGQGLSIFFFFFLNVTSVGIVYVVTREVEVIADDAENSIE